MHLGVLARPASRKFTRRDVLRVVGRGIQAVGMSVRTKSDGWYAILRARNGAKEWRGRKAGKSARLSNLGEAILDEWLLGRMDANR